MSNTAENNIKEKRRRISLRYSLEGEIVAKSYVQNFHKSKRITHQLVIYDSLSYKIIKRKIELIQSELQIEGI